MIANAGTWRAAVQMINLYGGEAVTICLMEADILLEQGDIEGCDIWERIVSAVYDLQRQAPEPGQLLN